MSPPSDPVSVIFMRQISALVADFKPDDLQSFQFGIFAIY